MEKSIGMLMVCTWENCKWYYNINFIADQYIQRYYKIMCVTAIFVQIECVFVSQTMYVYITDLSSSAGMAVRRAIFEIPPNLKVTKFILLIYYH